MLIVSEECEGNFYVDLILYPEDLRAIERNEMVTGETSLRHRNYYLGIRLKGNWDEEEKPEGEGQD